MSLRTSKIPALNPAIKKVIPIITIILALILLSSCATYSDPYSGEIKQGLTPTGSAIVQTLVATGVGAGAGSLMRNQPGWANGMVSGGSSSVVSQLVNGFLPKVPSGGNSPYGNRSRSNSYQRDPYQPQQGYPYRPQQGYPQQGYPQNNRNYPPQGYPYQTQQGYPQQSYPQNNNSGNSVYSKFYSSF